VIGQTWFGGADRGKLARRPAPAARSCDVDRATEALREDPIG